MNIAGYFMNWQIFESLCLLGKSVMRDALYIMTADLPKHEPNESCTPASVEDASLADGSMDAPSVGFHFLSFEYVNKKDVLVSNMTSKVVYGFSVSYEHFKLENSKIKTTTYTYEDRQKNLDAQERRCSRG